MVEKKAKLQTEAALKKAKLELLSLKKKLKAATPRKIISGENEGSFLLLFQNHPMPMWVYDKKTLKFLQVNDAAIEKYGYSQEEFQSLTIKDIRPAKDIAALTANLKKKRTKLEFSGDWRHKLKNGRIINVEITSHTLDFQGHEGILVFAQDITVRKQAEDALQQSQELLNGIINTAQDAVITLDEDQRIIIFNTAAERIFGCKAAEVIGGTIDRFIPKNSVKSHHEHIKKFAETGDTGRKMGRLNALFAVDINGREFPIDASISLINIQGQSFFTSIIRDITERKNSEELLNKSKSSLQGILQSTADGILAVNQENVVLFANENFSKMWGIPEEIISSKNDSLLLKFVLNQLEDSVEFIQKIKELYKSQSESFDILHFKDGRIFERLSKPILNESSLEGRVWSFRDITERRQIEDAVRKSEIRYRSLFEDSPIALWEEDFSIIKQRLDDLREQGVTDFLEYFTLHPQEVVECAALIKILDVNKATLKLFETNSKKDLFDNFVFLIKDEPIQQFKKELVNIAGGKTRFEWEGMIKTLGGKLINIDLTWYASSDTEKPLSRVIVSMIDITERKRREREQEAMASVIQALNQGLDLDVLLQNLLNAALHAIPLAEKGAILLSDSEGTLRIRALSGYSDPRVHSASFPSTSGYSARAVRERQPLIIANARADESIRYDLEIEEMWAVKSAIVAPLMVNGRAIGAISLDNATRKEAFGEGELTTLSTFASSAALVIQNTSLLEESRQRVAELELIYESGLAISQLLNPKEIGQKIIDLLEQKMNWHHTAIRLYNAADETLELLAFHQADIKSDSERLAMETRFKATVSHSNQGLSGWVVQHGKTVRTGDLLNDDRYIETFSGLHSGLYVPIKTIKRIIGVISIESEKENAFSASDEQLTTILAAQAASIFENARLYEETIQRAAELEKRVRERTAQIESTKRRFELATHAGQIGVWEYNPRENKVIWDERMHIIHHIPYGEFEGTYQAWAKLIHPDDIEKSQINIQLAITKNLLLSNEHRIFWPNGSIRTIATSAVTAFTEDGIPDRIIGINMDITERKNIEQSLRESENYARLLFNAVPDPISVTTINGNIEDVNQAFEQKFNYLRNDIQGKNISELGIYSKEELNKIEMYVGEIMKGQRTSIQLNFNIFPDTIRTLELHSYPIEIKDRQLIISASRDITAYKKAEDTLQLANMEMQHALRIKDEFLANMSHELRTPLNAILGISDSLEEQISGSLNEKQLKYVHIISESGRHLLDLINDILDLSKIEAGKLELNIQPFSVQSLCDSCLRLVKELAQKKSLKISFESDENVKTILGDERRLKQSIVNLLSNAVKFTPEGKELGLRVHGNLETSEVTFTVWDQGIGIDQKDIKRLFKPFVQLDASLTREYPGTGLGLVIVSQMVRLHGGHIGLESEIGKGSNFTITLPWFEQSQITQAEIKSRITTGSLKPSEKRLAKILLVEDTDVIVTLTTDYLRYKGYEVFIARNGMEGILLAKEEKPDIILMDIMMPIMDGLEATRLIRADDTMQNIIIIALTALAMPGDREQCLAAGMNDYISKPIHMQELAKTIKKHLTNRQEKIE